MRFQSNPIILHEIAYPPVRIRVRPETQLELKNSDYAWLHHRNVMWYSALVNDLKLISTDAATGDEEADAHLMADINGLIKRAEAEKQEISNLVNSVYNNSSPTDTLALNQVRAFRRDRLVEWQADFDRLPKPRLAQTISRDGRRASTFGSVRAMWPRRYDLTGAFDNPHMPSSSVSEAEESLPNMRRVTGDSFASSASEASEPELNVDRAEKPDPHVLTEKAAVEPPVANVDAGCKSDPDSDSTIGATRDDVVSSDRPQITALVSIKFPVSFSNTQTLHTE